MQMYLDILPRELYYSIGLYTHYQYLEYFPLYDDIEFWKFRIKRFYPNSITPLELKIIEEKSKYGVEMGSEYYLCAELWDFYFDRLPILTNRQKAKDLLLYRINNSLSWQHNYHDSIYIAVQLLNDEEINNILENRYALCLSQEFQERVKYEIEGRLGYDFNYISKSPIYSYRANASDQMSAFTKYVKGLICGKHFNKLTKYDHKILNEIIASEFLANLAGLDKTCFDYFWNLLRSYRRNDFIITDEQQLLFNYMEKLIIYERNHEFLTLAEKLVPCFFSKNCIYERTYCRYVYVAARYGNFPLVQYFVKQLIHCIDNESKTKEILGISLSSALDNNHIDIADYIINNSPLELKLSEHFILSHYETRIHPITLQFISRLREGNTTNVTKAS
jgi:YHS domain-containing protein